MARSLTVLWLALIVAFALAGCGGGDKGGGTSVRAKQTAAQTTANVSDDTVAATDRTNRLLDTWSDHLLRALLAGRDRGRAAASGNAAAFQRADRRLQRWLRPVLHYARDARVVMSQFQPSRLTRAVIRDGDAWTHWALEIKTHPNVNFNEATRIADLGVVGFRAHETAYRAAGSTPPAAFQRGPDQR